MIGERYDLEVVGGPYDGAPGFSWIVTEGMALPSAIAVGVCRGDGACNSADRACSRRCERHVAYWHPDLEDPPVATLRYVLQDGVVEPEGGAHGRAVYALGGLDALWRGEAREMVPAGAVGGAAYG